MEASVRFIAPTTYCSKLGVPLCFLPYLEIMQEKRKKKKEKPQTNKKAAQGRDKRLVYSSALRNFGKYFFF